MGTALSELLAQAAYGKSAWKLACRTIATANVTLSGLQTIGGVALAVGDRVLVTGQTNAAQNGPYTVSAGAWSRGIDFDSGSDVQYGSRFAITDGTASGQVWTMTNPTSGPIALGATLLTFSEIVTGPTWPGTTPASIDANVIYAYDCLETSGTTLANTGSGPNGTLNLIGPAYLGSKYPAKSRAAVRFLGNTSGHGALSGTACTITPIGGYSVEAYVASADLAHYGCVAVIDNGSGQDSIGISQYYTGSAPFWNVFTFVGGVVRDTSINQDFKVQARTVTHLLATYEFGVGMKLYINGVLGPSNGLQTGVMSPMTRVTVGTDAVIGGQSFKGYITQVRCHNVVRNADYALSRAENCFGL